ncbi:MAG: hypothetical protein IBJ18_11945 [Phycisphaerales bacterium]|nr:hypothetical protein [Phycisphaerales bacterium]
MLADPARSVSTGTAVACLLSLASLAITPSLATAQTVAPGYQSNYTVFNLGTPPGVPQPLGGINFLDRDTLLIGGSANNGSGAIYRAPITRAPNGDITGFAGNATLYCTAPNIDGGLWFFPNGTIGFTTYADNTLRQVKPFETTPARVDNLTTLGVSSSTGTGTIIPQGFNGAGNLIIGSYSASRWYILPWAEDDNVPFTHILSPALPTSVAAGNGPEGIVYVPQGSPLFPNQSVLISEYGAGRVSAFAIDNNGLPIPSTRTDFVTGLSGAEGGVLDPFTGQFLFSTFGGSGRVVVVRGFGSPVSTTRCQPADIADDQGTYIPSFSVNNGVNEGDYNAFFNGFFLRLSAVDIANDNGEPRPPFGPAGTNTGVNEGDYNCFFNNFFLGCPA